MVTIWREDQVFRAFRKRFHDQLPGREDRALVEALKEAGVEAVDSIESFEYGKFVHIMDPEGNKIELWEPVDQVFTDEYEGKTTH